MTADGARPVLVVAQEDDVHAIAVCDRLEGAFGIRAEIRDFAMLDLADTSFAVDAAGTRVTFFGENATEYGSIWWRRPRPPNGSRVAPEHSRFTESEWASYCRGVALTLDARIVNDPVRQRVCSDKPYQLAVAAACGLRVPATVITNDPVAVADFWAAHRRDCVYKTLRAHESTFLPTRRLEPADFRDWPAIQHAPVIVQERVPRGLEIRVNIFGSQVHAAEILPTAPSADVDWRTDVESSWRPHALPHAMGVALRHYLDRLELDYGCLDLIRTPEGDYVFIEVNPAGQFLFVEIDCDQPLAESMARLLLHAQHHPRPIWPLSSE